MVSVRNACMHKGMAGQCGGVDQSPTLRYAVVIALQCHQQKEIVRDDPLPTTPVCPQHVCQGCRIYMTTSEWCCAGRKGP